VFSPGVVGVEAEPCSLQRLTHCLKELQTGWVRRRMWRLHWSSVLGPVSVLGVELVENPAA